MKGLFIPDITSEMFRNECLEGIEALMAEGEIYDIEYDPSAQQWIPCSERLPGKDEPFYVLCCDKHGEIMIGHVFACNDGETPYSAESEHEYMYDCVAWCPLPEPWKGEKP